MSYLLKKIILLSMGIVFFSCQESLTSREIIRKSIHAHGWDEISGKKVQFHFRDKQYAFYKKSDVNFYERQFQDSLGYVSDVLINSLEFTRTIDGEDFFLDSVTHTQKLNALNSVVYFFQLPLSLLDDAVLASYQGLVTMGGARYHQVEVKFNQDNGGVDFEDVFVYWFDEESFELDYLSYKYHTNGGGIRFRVAINQRRVGGLLVQDYDNYKPDNQDVSLSSLLMLYTENRLEKVSQIINEEVIFF